MNIIQQNYDNLLKKVIFDTFSSNLKKELNKFDTDNVMNYVSLLSNLDESLCEIAKDSLVTIFETIDRSYRHTTERKSKYDIKSHHTRTIMTIFGEITFKRTFYVSKINRKSFCYLDRLLGLHKYDYFDPYLKALIVDYASDNPYPKVAKYINVLIGNRIKLEDSFKYISRQTVRNIIMNSKLSIPDYEQVENTPEVLYIIADEKFIHTQRHKSKDVMEKSTVVFDGRQRVCKNRYKLTNKRIFASLDKSFLQETEDYIFNTYDIDKIKTIYVMGDGASWIKKLQYEFKITKDVKVIFALDKFHFKQALRHILNEEEVTKTLTKLILNDEKQDFNRIVSEIIDLYPHREEIIEEKRKYILKNWKHIHNLYKYNLSCPMESQISHNIAALFSSRPKGYSVKTINKLTKLRLLFKNRFNIKKLYLNNFNSNEILTVDTYELNFDIYKKREYLNIYNQYLYSPDNYRFFK